MNQLNLAWETAEEAGRILRSLYSSRGYTQYKMNKFEEYELYVRNKDFLISDAVITFTDTNGKLLALKPDVTLSIIKNYRAEAGIVQKTYYNENVYRVASQSRSFKEIMQVGIECMGAVDRFCIFEVLSLAANSLRILSLDSVLDLSHFGMLSRLISSLGISQEAKRAVLTFVGEKNAHELRDTLQNEGVDRDRILVLERMISLCGAPDEVLPELKALLPKEEFSADLAQLEELCNSLDRAGFGDLIRLDFSVVDDLEYYNGIVFKGFIKGIPERILSGGQYDGLMRKMNRDARAIGFAVYMDLLEEISRRREEYDGDILLLYGENASVEQVHLAAEKLRAQGRAVTAQKAVPQKMAYRTVYRITESGDLTIEENA